jgi:hypothetical protein
MKTYKIPHEETHPHLLLPVKKCEERTLLKGKLTAIIETFQQPIERLLRTVFSLLLRSGPAVGGPLEHIIVCINGADRRTGPPEIQDAKQDFLEALRTLKWKVPGYEGEREMPITVLRVWSRVGHGQALDMAIPWVHTEGYIILDDDYIITNHEWATIVKENCLDTEDVDYFHQHQHIGPGCTENCDNQVRQMILPRLWANFTGGKKAVLEQCGVRWSSYFLNHDYDIEDFPEFYQYHEDMWKESHSDPVACMKGHYKQLVVESGAWAKYKLDQANAKGLQLPQCSVQNNDLFWHYGKGTIDVLDQEIYQVPEYWEVYQKHLPKIPEFSLASYENQYIDPNMKVLVCVCVYKRFNTIANWLRAWHNSNHYGAKIGVVHSLCHDKNHPLGAQTRLIKNGRPDYYLPRENVGQDIRALYDMLTEKRVEDWDALVWFTDDCIPMRKDWLLPFMVELSKPDVGFFGPFPEIGYCRTISFGIKKKAMKEIQWIENGKGILTRQHCLQMENQLSPRCQRAGYKLAYLYSRDKPDYIHWSHYSDWLWDADGLGALNLWPKFELQFPEEERIPGSLEGIRG